MDILLVITTMPDAPSAETLANSLVNAGLAACVNVGAPMVSIYKWGGELQRGTEVMLTVKTTTARYPAVEEAIRLAHPYELPEIIAVPISRGLPEYLDWINKCTSDC